MLRVKIDKIQKVPMHNFDKKPYNIELFRNILDSIFEICAKRLHYVATIYI